jgi:2,5-diketo-D-gluconate reductase B
MPMIRQAIDEIGAALAAHQIEYHPFLAHTEMLDYLRSQAM